LNTCNDDKENTYYSKCGISEQTIPKFKAFYLLPNFRYSELPERRAYC